MPLRPRRPKRAGVKPAAVRPVTSPKVRPGVSRARVARRPVRTTRRRTGKRIR